ncbi:hypothetical protein M409DRAFT_23967 [Zasmidium cellare ATCC 36951]|uniref:Methyltransferase type 11 domain-containing protein n=1 Tax=Zasmidium cellare ATCC 36951 TaxID=1080233 RepID=A0A6A6CEN7_ZASCE|nr:uncharacterized protein M409DRAFT_23967 [Zasmidium cellare ATCC 36951]KAF2165677.1 hypothetical protein M409DRAFT_23967 [Zasmidium cellare ATCC 36951]
MKPEHKGRFDVVAVRLLHSVLGQEDWDIVMSNIIALLRPGGWIQWADFDPLTPGIAAIKFESQDAAVIRSVLVRYVDNMKTKAIGDMHRIPSTFASRGLESVETDFYSQTEELEFTKVVVAGFIESLQEADEMSEMDARDMRVKVNHEIEGCRPVLKYDLWCHLAQKPL